MAFDVDANGIVTVTAKDKATGKTQSVRIEGSVGLSIDEIEKMKKEAEIHAEEDKKKQELIEARNLADNLVYTTEKAVKDAGDKVSADTKKKIEESVEALKKVKDGDNIEEIKQRTSELSQIIQQIGAELYGSTGSPQDKQQPKPEEKNPPAGGPEEGEYKEKQN